MSLHDNTPHPPSKAWGYLTTAMGVIIIQAIAIVAMAVALAVRQ
jgi:hypothetical protein